MALDEEKILPKALLDRVEKFTKDIKDALDALNKLFEAGKKNKTTLSDATSPSKVTDEIKKLSTAEKELIKVQNQLAIAQAKSSDAYIKEKKALDSVNQATKDKIALDGRSATTINKQNASIDQLNAALRINQAAYAKLTTEQERNSKSGQKLFEIIKNQKTSVTELNEAQGKFTDNVGHYPQLIGGIEKAFAGANPRVGGFVSGLKEATSASLKFLATPIGAIIGAVAAGIAVIVKSVSTFFDDTLEGQEKLNELSSYYNAIAETIHETFVDIGKAIVDAFVTPDGLKQLGTDILDYVTNPLNAAGKAAAFFAEKAEQVKIKQVIDLERARLENALLKERIKDKVDDANTEIQVRELLAKVADKAHEKDVDRLKYLLEANALLRRQAEGDLTLEELGISTIEKELELLGGKLALATDAEKLRGEEINGRKLISNYTNDEFLALKASRAEIDKLADAQVQYLKIKSDLAVKEKTFGKQYNTLQQEIYKAEKDRIDRLAKANTEYNKAIIEGDIQVNEKILASVKSSTEEKELAFTSNLVNRLRLLDIEKAAVIQSEKDIVRERVRAEGVPEQEIDGRVEKDKALKKKLEAVELEFGIRERDLTKDLVSDISKIYTEAQAKDIQALINTENNKFAITQESFAKGLLTVEQYQKALEEHKRTIDGINLNGSNQLFEREVQSYQALITLIKSKGGDVAELEQALQELRNKQAEAGANTRLKTEKEAAEESKHIQELKADFEKRLQDEVFAATQGIIQNASDAEAKRIDSKIKRIQDSAALELAAAGDNQALKDRINEEAQKKEKELYKEKSEQLRKYAIFEKAVSLIQIAINTQQAASKAYAQGGPIAGPLLAGLVIAAGVAQAAVVASKPIPQFWRGGMVKEDGIISTAERGQELIQTPNGQFFLTPNKTTLMMAEKGTQVHNAEDTTRILAANAFNEGGTQGTAKDVEFTSAVVKELREVKMMLANQPRVNYRSLLSSVLQTTEYNRTFKKTIRIAAFGNWTVKQD